MQDLPTVAEHLYELDPTRFVAARGARARAASQAGDPGLARQIGVLRKPSTPAWAINLLVRQHRVDVQRLLVLADRLRAPGADDAPTQLREWNQMAHRVVTAVTRLAADRAAERGHPLSAGHLDLVRATLRAAMADPAAARALLSGQLVTTLEASGLGGLATGAASTDIAAAVAIPLTDTPPTAAPPDAGRPDDGAAQRDRLLAAALRAAQAAQSEAADAARRAQEAKVEADRLREHLAVLAEAAERARRLQQQRQHRLDEARHRLAGSERELGGLDARARAARRRAEDATATLRALSADGGSDRA